MSLRERAHWWYEIGVGFIVASGVEHMLLFASLLCLVASFYLWQVDKAAAEVERALSSDEVPHTK